MTQTVVIVGPGLIGGSLGMALRAVGFARKVIGVGHRRESLDAALQLGALDEATTDLNAASRAADLLVLATSVATIPRQAEVAIPLLRPSAVLTDVGSVKATICREVRRALLSAGRADVHFVGGHPLAGSEQRGIAAARSDLFKDALCLLTPTPDTDRAGAGLAAVRDMWRAVGCRVREISPERHDELIAQISHLPHVMAACLVNAVSSDALALAARGFLDVTRVASGDPALWTEICLANRDSLLAALDALGDEFREFTEALEAADGEALLDLLRRAKDLRDARARQEGR